MFHNNTHLLHQLAEDRHAELRRAAGASRLRRDARQAQRRRRQRTGPDR